MNLDSTCQVSVDAKQSRPIDSAVISFQSPALAMGSRNDPSLTSGDHQIVRRFTGYKILQQRLEHVENLS